MEEFKDLIQCLCTEEMVLNKTGKKVEVNSKIGFLVAYCMDLGFTFITITDYVGENCETELMPKDIKIL